MALTNRATVRAEVSALFDGISTVQENLAYPPLKLSGKSPVLTLHDDGSVAQLVSKNSNQLDHYFILTIYVNREAHGAAASETVLDQVFTDCLQAIRDHVIGTSFMDVVADTTRSRPYFATIDGKPYRVEEIALMTRSNPNG